MRKTLIIAGMTGLCLSFFVTVVSADKGSSGPETWKRRPNTLLYKIRDDATAGQLEALGEVLKKHRVTTLKRLVAGKVIHAEARGQHLPSEEKLAAELNGTGAVEFAEPDYVAPPLMIPNDPTYPVNTWHLQNINAPAAWDITTGSTNVIIAILDSGGSPTHPDLAPNYVAGWNCYDNNADTHDVSGHGTAAAGVAGAVGNNGIGVASVSWHSKIMPVRVTDATGMGSWSAIVQGLQWAVDHGAKVCNLSFATLPGSSSVRTAAQYVHEHGGLVVLGAGNDGKDPGYQPSPYLINVAATRETNLTAPWSDYGAFITVCAPGEGIMTCATNGGYIVFSGTSASAPVVCGVLALEWSVNPSLSNSQVQDILFNTALDLGDPGWDAHYGYGKIDVCRAVAAAAGVAGNQPPVAAISASPVSGRSPLTVSFNGSGSSDSDGNITSYTWYFGEPGTTGSGKTTSHTYTSTNIYQAQLVVTDNTGATAPALVTIRVLNGQPAAAISASPTSGVAPLSVSFSGAGSSTPNGAITSYDWNFGDGATGTAVTVSHAYTATGMFTATLTVTDSMGATAATNAKIRVNFNHAPVAAGQTVTTLQENAVEIVLTATDADTNSLTYSIATQPAHGAFNGTPPSVAYVPADGYRGNDVFTFKANDGHVDSNMATVTVAVTKGTLTSHGTPQWWLAKFGCTNASEAASLDDSDGDGLANWQEYIAGTNPTNPASQFRVGQMSSVGAGVRLGWTTYSNWVDTPFGVERCTNLFTGWQLVDGNIIRTPPTNTWSDTNPPADVPSFYRLVATNMP